MPMEQCPYRIDAELLEKIKAAIPDEKRGERTQFFNDILAGYFELPEHARDPYLRKTLKGAIAARKEERTLLDLVAGLSLREISWIIGVVAGETDRLADPAFRKQLLRVSTAASEPDSSRDAGSP